MQLQDQWAKMRSNVHGGEAQARRTRAPPSSWTPWYKIFDNIFDGIAKINGVPHNID